MTDKKTIEDDSENAAVPAPDTGAEQARTPEDAVVEDQDGVPGDATDADETRPEDAWDDPEDAVAEDVTPRADPLEIELEDEAKAESTLDEAPAEDLAEDPVEHPVEEPVEDPDVIDEHHDEYDDHARPSLAGRALRALVILLIGGGAALWAAPKVAPMLPASVSRHLVVAVPVEVSEFEAYRAEAQARIAALEASMDERAEALSADIEIAGKSGLTGDEVDAIVADAAEALSTRVAALNEALVNGDLAGLAARIAALETQTAGLTRQFDSLAGGLASVGAETGSVGEMSQAAVARLAANAAQIDGLRGQIDMLSQQSGALAQRLEQAENDAAARTANAEAEAERRATGAAAAAAEVKAAAEARARLATINAALDEIAASLDTGAPYEDRLARVDAEAPAALAATASTGVPTNAALRTAFIPLAHEAIRADALATAEGGVLGGIWAGVSAQFTGVPTEATGGDDVAGILGEASGLLGEDDIAGALAALDRLPPEAAAPMAPWVDRARLRGDAKSALAAWRAALAKIDG